MLCPLCGHDNMDGEDLCTQCGSDLMDQDIPLPRDEISALVLQGRVSQIATPAPIAVAPDDSVNLAIQRMQVENIRSLVVVENDLLVGILTERDLIVKLDPGVPTPDRQVREFMTPRPIVVNPDDSIATVLQRMVIDHVRHLPVVENGRAVGIISMRDVLHRLIPALLP